MQPNCKWLKVWFTLALFASLALSQPLYVQSRFSTYYAPETVEDIQDIEGETNGLNLGSYLRLLHLLHHLRELVRRGPSPAERNFQIRVRKTDPNLPALMSSQRLTPQM